MIQIATRIPRTHILGAFVGERRIHVAAIDLGSDVSHICWVVITPRCGELGQHVGPARDHEGPGSGAHEDHSPATPGHLHREVLSHPATTREAYTLRHLVTMP